MASTAPRCATDWVSVLQADQRVSNNDLGPRNGITVTYQCRSLPTEMKVNPCKAATVCQNPCVFEDDKASVSLCAWHTRLEVCMQTLSINSLTRSVPKRNSPRILPFLRAL